METRNDFRVGGVLIGPPSCPDLPVGGIGVTATLLGEGLTFQATTDGQGRFELAGVPGGVLALQSEAEHGGLFYYGDEMVGVDRDLSLTVVMNNPAVDLLAPDPAMPEVAEVAESQADDLCPDQPADGIPPIVPGTQVIEVEVRSKKKDEVCRSAKAFELPREVNRVELKYTVTTKEYEKWVQKASPYNDVWSICVYAGQGQEVHRLEGSICKKVNEMLTGGPDDPVWKKVENGWGTTGEMIKKFDLPQVEGETRTVVLVAAAKNIEDARFPTAVKAALSSASAAQAKIRVAAKAPENLNHHPEPSDDTGVDSIPPFGEENSHKRYFTIEVIEPAGGVIEHVEVLLIPSGAEEMTVADVAGSALEIDTATRFPKVLVSMHGEHWSEYDSPPPAFDTFVYRFKVTVRKDGVQYQGEIDSGRRTALWHMPTGIARFGQGGTPEVGSDDWCSRATYNWLVAARDAGWLTAINDISGEHGTNLVHVGHRHGKDIDLFHFYLDNNGSGGTAYTALRQQVVAASRGNVDAQFEVELWIEATRQGMDRFLEDPDVLRVIYAEGQAADGLPAGWLSGLLKEGRFAEYDTGLGQWANRDNPYLEWDRTSEHNSHLHIGLDFGS